ncbi:MAG: hypothetical protein HY210_02135 [Candidatus Omnitrophica bacterium]|nr:hypothetical protein [Candidatus Omnitrophota bacterium]
MTILKGATILETDMKGFFTNPRRELIGKSFVNNIVPILLAATLATDFFLKATLHRRGDWRVVWNRSIPRPASPLIKSPLNLPFGALVLPVP